MPAEVPRPVATQRKLFMHTQFQPSGLLSGDTTGPYLRPTAAFPPPPPHSPDLLFGQTRPLKMGGRAHLSNELGEAEHFLILLPSLFHKHFKCLLKFGMGEFFK